MQMPDSWSNRLDIAPVKIEPALQIMVLFVLRKFKRACAAILWARGMVFGWTLFLLPYFMHANSEGSGETARMRRLAFACRLCDNKLAQLIPTYSDVCFFL